jgi:hypothetical protein
MQATIGFRERRMMQLKGTGGRNRSATSSASYFGDIEMSGVV